MCPGNCCGFSGRVCPHCLHEEKARTRKIPIPPRNIKEGRDRQLAWGKTNRMLVPLPTSDEISILP